MIAASLSFHIQIDFALVSVAFQAQVLDDLTGGEALVIRPAAVTAGH